jgi:hypothetical protein
VREITIVASLTPRTASSGGGRDEQAASLTGAAGAEVDDPRAVQAVQWAR